MAKILYVITRLAVGGAPHTVLSAIRGLKDAGYDITLASGYPGEGEGSLVAAAQALDVAVVFIPPLQRAVHPLRDVSAFWHLWRLMKKGQFDLIHTHLSKAGILGRLAAFCAGIRVLHTFHGDVLDGYFSPLKSRIFLMVERFVGCMTDRFVCVSDDLKARLLAYQLGSADRFCVVRNGIDLEKLKGVTPQSKCGNRVGTLAMFYPIKRLDLFVEMAHQLQGRGAHILCEVAGDGITASALKAQSHKLGDPVHFVGVCEDPASFLSQLDVFVLCSDFESSGLSVMEAMCMGLPVVATAVGGIPENVQDGQTGILVAAGDVAALTDAVWALLQDDDKRKQLGSAAQAYANTHFSTDRMVSDLDRLYRELLS